MVSLNRAKKSHFNNAYFSICLGCWNFEFYENTRVPGDYKVRKTKERDSFGINEYIFTNFAINKWGTKVYFKQKIANH
jgi:hypothetical protein